MRRLDGVLYLLLFRVKIVLVLLPLEVSGILFKVRLLPRVDSLDQRLVDREVLI